MSPLYLKKVPVVTSTKETGNKKKRERENTQERPSMAATQVAEKEGKQLGSCIYGCIRTHFPAC